MKYAHENNFDIKKADIIFWSSGVWDVAFKQDLIEYKQNLLAIANQLQSLSNAKIVFRTIPRFNSRSRAKECGWKKTAELVPSYNEVSKFVQQKYGFDLIDVETIPRDDEIYDGIHFARRRMGRQNEMEQKIEFQPFNGTPSSRVVNDTTLTRTFYTPTSGIIYACAIVLLLFSNCVLLGRVASGIQGTNSELQVQRQNVEYKTIVWDEDKFEVNPRSFFKAMMREGLTNNTFASCSWPQYTENYSVNGRTMAVQWLRFFENNDRISKGFFGTIIIDGREEEETLFFFFIAPLLSKSSSFPFILKFLSTSMFPSSSAFLLVVGSRARISSERERCVQCEL